MTTELLSKLPQSIVTIVDAEQMLLALTSANKFYHLDDNPADIEIFTEEESAVLNRLINQADGVTRKFYDMEERPECLVGLWEGLIKDQLPVGYICFAADKEPNEVFVYNDNKVGKVSFTDWKSIKSNAWNESENEYDVSKIDSWFEQIT